MNDNRGKIAVEGADIVYYSPETNITGVHLSSGFLLIPIPAMRLFPSVLIRPLAERALASLGASPHPGCGVRPFLRGRRTVEYHYNFD